MSKTIGIFGLGLIGTALAERFLKAGHSVLGFDPDDARCSHLQQLGGAPADPDQLWQSDILLSAVFSTDQLGDIIAAAPGGIGKVLVTMSTCDPDEIVALEATAKT